MKKVIVTDVKYRMAISPIRELAKKGYDITTVDFDDVPQNERICDFSRFSNEKGIIYEDEKKFAQSIKNLCSDDTTIIPVNRKSLMNVIKNEEEISKYCNFLVPSEEAIKIADDKDKICQIAKSVNVPVPSTTSLREHNSITEMAEKINFPCIIKYRNGEAMGLKPKERYRIVNTKEEFIDAYKKMNDIDNNPIASDYITGHDIGVAVVMNKQHKPVDFICYESFREYPIEGGPTCFLKTIFNRELLKYACTLLEKIEFTGVAMLDFKGSPNDPYFLEINPRVWGSASITEISNSTFFESYVKASKDEIAPIDLDTCKPTYKVNAKMRFTPQSFACFAAHMKKSKYKIKIFFEYFKSFFDFEVKDGLFSFNDSKPYFKYIQNLIRNR